MLNRMIKTVLCSSFLVTPVISHAENGTTLNPTDRINVAKETRILRHRAPSISPHVLKLALTAYNNARKLGYDNKGILTVIDYHQPDNAKRFYVFDLKHNRLLYNTYVAHGLGSGSVYASRFSNRIGSHESSLGLYVTKNAYYGEFGYALRIDGLDRGFNDNAFKRDIVVHGAKYVKAYYAKEYGYIGRSWGCPSVPKRLAEPVINTIKGGTLIFAYAPNQRWLAHSKFLQSV